MNRQFAGYQIRLGRQYVQILANARDFARAFELAQIVAQGDAFPAL